MANKKRASRAEYFREYRKKNKPAKRVSITMSPTEYAELEKEAERHGQRPTSFLKSAYFAYLSGKPVLPAGVEDKLSELIAQLRKIGSNLNQIARHANRFQKVSWGAWRSAKGSIEEMEKRMSKFIRNQKK